jgi:excisionase family DNA binding protein
MISNQLGDHGVSSALDPKFPVHRVAEMLSVSPQTIYREIAAGRMNCYWVGSSIRVGLSHLNSYLIEKQRGQSTPGA